MVNEGLLITDEWQDEVFEISANGDLIITNAKLLQRHIDKAIQEGARDIILNLRYIQYIDSFGIGVIVKTKAEVDKKKGSLRVLVNPTLQNLFEKCHLDDYIDLELVEEETE